MNTLNDSEVTLLAACEQNIAQDIDAFRRVGMSLATIRDSRLYRAEFKTFEEYCEQKWQISRRRADQQIAAAEVAAQLEQQGVSVANESQAAALVNVPAEKRAEVMHIVANSGEKVTSAKITEAAKSVTSTATNEKNFSQSPADKIGRSLCKHAQSVYGALVDLENLTEDYDAPEAEDLLRGAFIQFELHLIERHLHTPQRLEKLEFSLLKLLEKVQAAKSEVPA